MTRRGCRHSPRPSRRGSCVRSSRPRRRPRSPSPPSGWPRRRSASRPATSSARSRSHRRRSTPGGRRYPSGLIVKIAGTHQRRVAFRTNAIRSPSGDHVGMNSRGGIGRQPSDVRAVDIDRRRCRSDTRTRAGNPAVHGSIDGSYLVLENTIFVPSGDHDGPRVVHTLGQPDDVAPVRVRRRRSRIVGEELSNAIRVPSGENAICA